MALRLTQLKCPFCAFETEEGVLVCSACARDIVVPPSLIAERDDLVRKLASARDELFRVREEITQLTRRGKHGSS
jgi:hypothetical protein